MIKITFEAQGQILVNISVNLALGLGEHRAAIEPEPP